MKKIAAVIALFAVALTTNAIELPIALQTPKTVTLTIESVMSYHVQTPSDDNAPWVISGELLVSSPEWVKMENEQDGLVQLHIMNASYRVTLTRAEIEQYNGLLAGAYGELQVKNLANAVAVAALTKLQGWLAAQ